MSDSYEVGELAYCENEEGAWIGEISSVEDKVVTVKWFADGQRYNLPRRQVTPFAQYLNDQYRARKLKIVYELFYGVRLERMPSVRLQEFQRLLKQHGVDFDPDAASADDPFKMWPNAAHLSRAERSQRIEATILPGEVTDWLPKWLVTDPLPPSSRDPLGLQADAGRLADGLLPGLTVFTSRVGYFFFLAWAVREINQLGDLNLSERRDLLNRLERALVLSETLYHGTEPNLCFHLGQRVKGRLLAETGLTAHIPDRILKNQYSSGCLNLYRTAMSSCGFWDEDDGSSAVGKLPFRLTARGERLAELFGKRDAAKDLLRWAREDSVGRSRGKVQAWGEMLCFKTWGQSNERKRLLEGLLYVTGERSDVVAAADTRQTTVRVLSRSHLPKSGRLSSQTLIGGDMSGADVTQDELPEADSPLSNAAVLLHFYRRSPADGADVFFDAAIYELLGLGLNAIWKSLLDEVKQRGRLNLEEWLLSQIQAAQSSQLWQAAFEQATHHIPLSEEQLVECLLNGESLLENGVSLLAKVLGKAHHLQVLRERLSTTAVYTVISSTILGQNHSTIEDGMRCLLPYLVHHHQQVSERKGKRGWLQLDGVDIYADDARDMALGFHSYRFPQLFSLLNDLGIDWRNDGWIVA